MDSYLKEQPLAPSDADAEKLALGDQRALGCEQNDNQPAWKFAWIHTPSHLGRNYLPRLLPGTTYVLRPLTSPAVLLSLLPSFVVSALDRSPRSKKAPSKNHLSALDGLRGISCLMVMHMHWAFAVTDSNKNGSPETNTKYLFHRPFFYLFWAGTSHVNIFFVMSGYVLSVRCLNMLHKGSPAYNVLASSILRRACRIFLPPLALLFVFLVAIRLYVFDRANAIYNDNREHRVYQLAFFEAVPPILPTFYDQLRDVLGASYSLMDPSPHPYFPVPSYATYDTHLWTIAKEFYCSMSLFVVLVGTSRLHTGYRLSIHLALVAFCWLVNHQNHGLFFAGMTIAELDILLKQRHDSRKSSAGSLDVAKQESSSSGAAWNIFSYLSPSNLLRACAFIVGCYLLSLPLVWAEDTPAFRPLISRMPAYMQVGHRSDALRALGAVLVVWPITYTSTTADAAHPPHLIRAVFENPVSKYLGQISFSFYLIHGFVIRSLGYTILPALYTLVVSDPQRRDALADRFNPTWGWIEADVHITAGEIGAIWILGYLVVLTACVWMSDLFWRAVDIKSMSLGRWIEEKMVQKEDTSEQLGGRAGKIS